MDSSRLFWILILDGSENRRKVFWIQSEESASNIHPLTWTFQKTLGLSLSSQKFAPRLDGDFFEADLLELLKTAPPKPTLNTLLENEALVFGKFVDPQDLINQAI